MAPPSNRKEFKEYVLRKLGAPVIQINISDEQVEDRIDEAISFFTDYHYNGSVLIYLKHQLTADDIETGYVEIPDAVIGVSRIFDIGATNSLGTGMFNVQYQFFLNNVHDLMSGDLHNYYMSMQNVELMQEVLSGKPLIRYNRHINKLAIDRKGLAEGTYVIIECYAMIDTEEFNKFWTDRWLQNYTAVLIKEQWGSHLSKFTNMQLVGGVQFNGEQIYNDAKEERQRMEDQAMNSLQPLIYNFIG